MTQTSVKAVAIGASAGAVQALLTILPALPTHFPCAVLVVVHVPPDRDNALAPLLQSKCKLLVKEAEDKEPIESGAIYLAPSDYHLLVETDQTLALSADEAVNYSRPAIDAYGAELVGVILTGANHDGAAGLKAVQDAGGLVIVEDPVGAYAAAMPLAALEACPSATIMNIDAIASYLSSLGTA